MSPVWRCHSLYAFLRHAWARFVRLAYLPLVLLTPDPVCSGLDRSGTMERENLADFVTLSESSVAGSAEQGTQNLKGSSDLKASTIGQTCAYFMRHHTQY